MPSATTMVAQLSTKKDVKDIVQCLRDHHYSVEEIERAFCRNGFEVEKAFVKGKTVLKVSSRPESKGLGSFLFVNEPLKGVRIVLN